MSQDFRFTLLSFSGDHCESIVGFNEDINLSSKGWSRGGFGQFWGWNVLDLGDGLLNVALSVTSQNK